MTFRALLDTCVLVPSLQRDLLLQLAAEGTYAPYWSSGTLDELNEVLAELRRRRGMGPDAAGRAQLLQQMRRAFPGSETFAPVDTHDTFGLADPDDGHVVLAAINSKADVLVSSDTRAGFEQCQALDRAGIGVVAPAEFICDNAAAHPAAAVRAIQQMAARRRHPPLTPNEMLNEIIRRYPSLEELAGILTVQRSGQ